MRRARLAGAAGLLAAFLGLILAGSLVSCSDGVFSGPPTTPEIATASGLTPLGPEQAAPEGALFIENLKRDLPDSLNYPTDPITLLVASDPASGYTPGLTWDTSSDGPNTAVDADGDGTPDYYAVSGNLFIETGEYSDTDGQYVGSPLRLTGTSVTVAADGSIDGTAELPSFADVGGFFSGIEWSDISPARVITGTGADIKAMLEAVGNELTMPLLDERTYFLFFLNGDLTVMADDGFVIELPVVPNMPTASFAFVLDSADPMFYLTYAVDKGFLEEEDDAAVAADGTGGDTAAEPMSSEGLMSFSGITIDGFGLSKNGWITVERANSWPFNEDVYGNALYDDLDVLNVYAGDPRDYDPAGEEYLPLFPTVSRVTYTVPGIGDGGSSTERRVIIGIPDPASYDSVEILCNDPIPRLYYYDVEQLNHIFIQGELPLENLGIPATVTDVAVLIDPEGSMGDITGIGNADLPFRLVSNGNLQLFPRKEDSESFFQIPEDFTGFTVLAEHTASMNRLLFTMSGDTRNHGLTDFVDMSQLGEIPDMGIGSLPSTPSVDIGTSIIGDDSPSGFLSGIDMDWLDGLAHPADASFNIAAYMSFPPGPTEAIYMVNAEFDVDPFSMINSALGTDIQGPTARLSGSVMYGYPYGVYLSGFMDFSIPYLPIRTAGDAVLSSWIVAQDNWGFHFDTNLAMDLFGGMGGIELQDAYIDLNNEEFALGGMFSLDTSLPNTSASVSMDGLIDFATPDFQMHGDADITLIGYNLLDATMDIGYRSGVMMAGRLTVPNLSTVEVEGSFSPATSDFTLGGSANITLFEGISTIPNIELGGASVYLSNSGVSVAGSLKIPGAGADTVAVGGEIETDGDFRFYGTGDITVAGLELAGAAVEFYNDGGNAGIIMRGDLDIPHLFSTKVAGEMDLDAGRLSLSGVADISVPGTSVTLASAAVEIVCDVDIDVNGGAVASNLALKITTGFSIGDYLNTTITTNPDISISVSTDSLPTVDGSVCGECVLSMPKFGFNFDRLGFDIEFSVSGRVEVDITLYIDTADFAGNGFAIAAAAFLEYSHPWVTSEWKTECETVLGVELCIGYPVFHWTTRTGSLSVSGGISLTGSGVSFYVDLPVVGRKHISF